MNLLEQKPSCARFSRDTFCNRRIYATTQNEASSTSFSHDRGDKHDTHEPQAVTATS